MHQAFNFAFLSAAWEPGPVMKVINESLPAFGSVGAPSTWVLSNHDVVRHPSRLALPDPAHSVPHGLGPRSPQRPDPNVAMRIGRAATALMLALPGSAYLYQGEELGLPEVIDIPDKMRQDPTFRRTGGERYGRDGCRVPLPWEADAPSFGFSRSGKSWLPQPAEFATLARDQQRGVEGSTLELYRLLLQLRKTHALGSGCLMWIDSGSDQVLAFDNNGVEVWTNFSHQPVTLPEGRILASSLSPTPGELESHHTVWLRRS